MDPNRLSPPGHNPAHQVQVGWTWDQLVNQIVDTNPVTPETRSIVDHPINNDIDGDEPFKNELVENDTVKHESVADEPTANTTRASYLDISFDGPNTELPKPNLKPYSEPVSVPTTARASTVEPKVSEDASAIAKEIEVSKKEPRLSHSGSHSGSSTVNEQLDDVATVQAAKKEEDIEMNDMHVNLEAGFNTADQEATVASKTPYSAFPTRAKRFIVLGAASASVFAPLSMQIYLPALNDLVDDFGVDRTKINLTVTVYMIFMALSPMVIGGIADVAGRRPALLICFAVYIASCVLLALCKSYTELMAFRIIQSIGASPTIAIASAVVADIVTSAERGSYAALVAVPVIFAPTLGPVIGGLLTEYLGWRAIFWFLLVAGGLAFFLILLFFPETCRVIVGDASGKPPRLYRTVVQAVENKGVNAKSETAAEERARLRGQMTRKTMLYNAFLSCVQVLFTKERFFLLVYVGIIFSGFNAIATEIPTQFKSIYGYDSLMVGIMYLPMAGGAMISTVIVGRQMNKNFRRHAARLGINIEEGQQVDMNEFPAERARLEVALPSLFLCTAGLICWGWVLEQRTTVAAPCVLLFFLGVGLNGVMATTNALLMDISQAQTGAVMAASNMTRCALGAVASAVIQPMINKLGVSWAYVIYGVIYLAFSPLLVIQILKGHKWRKQAKEREDKKRERRLVVEEALHVDGGQGRAAETETAIAQRNDESPPERLIAIRFSAVADAAGAVPAIPLAVLTPKNKSVSNSVGGYNSQY